MPLISLITPVYNTKESWLRECLDSVLNQTFKDWELCLCNNGSDSYILNVLQEYGDKDSRIRITSLPVNEGGYKGLQAALDISSGKYVGLLDSDDILPNLALERIAQPIFEYAPDILYTDEMIANEEGIGILPFYKPNYSKYLLYLLHYWGHLTIYRSALIKRLGIRHYGGSYDYDLALRAVEITKHIYHINEILYYYRTYPASTSARTREECMRGGLKTLQEHLDLKHPGLVATIEDPLYKISYINGLDFKPKIPTFNQEGDHLMKRLFNL
jgi:glycosyltransferase involved in cell wall biosynthesis